jgi:hypothetical protein
VSALSAHQTDFPAEFANFVAYVGSTEIQRSVDKVIRKLAAFGVAERNLFGTRYFFHEEMARFTDGSQPFQLDIQSSSAIRAASFVAGTNRARLGMSEAEARHFKGMIIDNMKPDRDFRQIEHEIRCFIHLKQKGHDVRFADLGKAGSQDLLCGSGANSFEVECKTVSQDTGNPIKSEMIANLAKQFFSLVKQRSQILKAGIYSVEFGSKPRMSNDVLAALQSIVLDASATVARCEDATITFHSRPLWDGCKERLPREAIVAMIAADPDVSGRHCFTMSGNNLVGLSVENYKPNEIASRATRVLKDAADQLSGTRAAFVWLHFIGLPERDFLELARFAMDGQGRGLNAVVANALTGRGSVKGRNHVNAVIFSAEAEGITHRPALDRQLMLAKSASVGGPVYVVRNPQAQFTAPDDVV